MLRFIALTLAIVAMLMGVLPVHGDGVLVTVFLLMLIGSDYKPAGKPAAVGEL